MIIKSAALLCLLFLLYLMLAADTGHLPNVAVAAYGIPYGDKVGHFAVYGLTAFFLALAFPRSWRVGRLSLPVAVLVFLILSIGEEWAQALFPRRTADPLDALCSCAGILAGAWAAARARRPTKAPLTADGCNTDGPKP